MNRKGGWGAAGWRTAAGEDGPELSERSGPEVTAQRLAATGVAPRAAARPAEGHRVGAAVATAAKKLWIVLVIVAVLAVAGFCVNRLRGFFGVHDNRPVTSGIADEIKPFNPKHVVYDVYGPPGAVANINYLDINAQPQKASTVALPWTLSVITTLPSVSVNLVAQADTDQIGCRIIVNDVVKDERSATGVNAQTFCIVKSA